MTQKQWLEQAEKYERLAEEMADITQDLGSYHEYLHHAAQACRAFAVDADLE